MRVKKGTRTKRRAREGKNRRRKRTRRAREGKNERIKRTGIRMKEKRKTRKKRRRKRASTGGEVG